ncbi:hypothetical protein GF352_04885, partial [archaeon]|nr:hypothetical protein [archaeon]
MGITLKGLGGNAEEAYTIDNYLKQGLSDQEALNKTLYDSFSKTFEKGDYADQKEIHYQGITDCD